MGLEIERKFLVDKGKWDQTPKHSGTFYRQGYISVDPLKTIRVRLGGDKAFFTIKGMNTGMVRSEYEYTIPVADAVQLLNEFGVAELTKTRYLFPYQGHTWEVDEFHGANAGLIVAEIELRSEEEAFARPEWVAEEVTNDARYYNANLCTHPYTAWSTK